MESHYWKDLLRVTVSSLPRAAALWFHCWIYATFSFLEGWRSLGLCDGWGFSTNSPRDTFLSSATQVLLWGPSWWRTSNGSPRKQSWRLAISSGPSWSFYFSGMQNVQPPSLPQKGCYVLDWKCSQSVKLNSPLLIQPQRQWMPHVHSAFSVLA